MLRECFQCLDPESGDLDTIPVRTLPGSEVIFGTFSRDGSSSDKTSTISEAPSIPDLVILKLNLSRPQKSEKIKHDNLYSSALWAPKCYKNAVWGYK